MGTFDGLSVALSGLSAQRKALDVAGQNIANANTEGYSRQRVLMTSVGAPAVAGVWTGRSFTGGVSVSGVDRLRDALLEVRGQQAHGALADLTASQTVVTQVEQLFPEPSDDGLAHALSDLWSAFHDVANQPGDVGTRTALLQRAGTVADWLNETSARLSALSGDIATQARSDVDQVNALAGQVADLNTSIVRARDGQLPVVQGQNGTMTPTARAALATEVEGLRDNLLSSANSTYLGRPLFGGTTSSTRAYDSTTGAYLGDTGVVSREVGSATAVRVDVTGPEAFGPAGADLFSTLTSIANDLRTTPANLGADLTALDGVSARMTTALTDVGARYNRLERAVTSVETRTDDLTISLSSIEDIDLAKTIYDLNVAQLSYQGALQATAKVIQPSLMDFLR